VYNSTLGWRVIKKKLSDTPDDSLSDAAGAVWPDRSRSNPPVLFGQGLGVGVQGGLGQKSGADVQGYLAQKKTLTPPGPP